MKDLDLKILTLIKKDFTTRKIYQKFSHVEPKVLLSFLEAQIKLNDILEVKPILKEVFDGYLNLFDLNPLEILEKIEFKSDEEIRMEFEKDKYDGNVSSGKKNFVSRERNSFKTGIASNDGGGDFSNFGRDLNI